MTSLNRNIIFIILSSFSFLFCMEYQVKIIAKDKVHQEKNNKIKKISLLNVILVFIISIIALIILVDTFKNPISLIFPDIKFILNSLYETLTDIILFFKDLL